MCTEKDDENRLCEYAHTQYYTHRDGDLVHTENSKHIQIVMVCARWTFVRTEKYCRLLHANASTKTQQLFAISVVPSPCHMDPHSNKQQQIQNRVKTKWNMQIYTFACNIHARDSPSQRSESADFSDG